MSKTAEHLPDAPGNIAYKHIEVAAFGGPEALHLVDAQLEPPREGYARVAVAYAGVGYTDVMARGGEYLMQRRRPFTPGYELAGEVVDFNVPHSAGQPSWLKPGSRVAACLPKMGGYAEYVSLPTTLLAPVPDELSLEVAAAIGLNYLTALALLEKSTSVTEGDAVLIQGAGGGVGEALSQLGKQKRLKMYGTASRKDFARLEQLGVRPIDYRTEDYAAVLGREEPNGVQAVYDHLGGAHLRKGRDVLAPGGTVASYAFVGRPGHILTDTIRGAAQNKLLNLFPGKNMAICSLPSIISKDPTWYQQSMARLFAYAVDGSITPTMGEQFPLAEAANAHRLLENHQAVGKITLNCI